MAIWQPQNFSGYMYNHLYTPPTQLHTHCADHTHTYRCTAHWIGNLQNMASWLASQDWCRVRERKPGIWTTDTVSHGKVPAHLPSSLFVHNICPVDLHCADGIATLSKQWGRFHWDFKVFDKELPSCFWESGVNAVLPSSAKCCNVLFNIL